MFNLTPSFMHAAVGRSPGRILVGTTQRARRRVGHSTRPVRGVRLDTLISQHRPQRLGHKLRLR